MRKTILFLFMLIFLSYCKDTGIEVDPDNEGNAKDKCVIISNKRNDGNTTLYIYEKNKVIGIEGFADFNTLVYNGIYLEKAINSKDKSYEIAFEYNQDGLLSKVNFIGRDSQNRQFIYSTHITYNKNRDIGEMVFNWPTLEETIVIFNYDTKGNIKTILANIDGRMKNLLWNKSFDDKNAPYQSQQIGRVFSYFMVYGLLVGGENWTYYLNQNNVLESEVYIGNSTRKFSSQYQYNNLEFPISARTTIKVDNNSKERTETFGYDCF